MIIPFESWHLGRMTITPGAKTVALASVEKLEALSKMGLVGTIAKHGVLLGVVGAVPRENNECEVFIVSTEQQKRFPKEFVTDVRLVLDHARAHFGRIVALGEDAPFFTRWFSWLGFEREGMQRGMVLWGMRGRN